MPQEYGHLANQAVKEDDFICPICTEKGYFSWTDFHGEAYHIPCGMSFQLIHYEKDESGKNVCVDKPPIMNVREEWVPVLKQYWEETKQFMGLGTYMILRDYPECLDGRKKLDDWLDEHPELLPT